MPTVEEYTDPLIRALTPPPAIRDGVCEICHSWTGTRGDGARYRRCSSCTQTARAVQHPVELIIPVSLYVVGEQLHTILSGYKNSQSESARTRLRWRVAALAARFLRDHSVCVRRAGGRTWDVMTIVPSSGTRAGAHPLEEAIRMARSHRPEYESLLERTEVPIDHRVADERGYRVTQGVEGKRVLIIDDTYTTGARLQSAASALALAGADVVAAVVLGRVVRPTFSPEASALWEQRRAIPFEFDVCCVEEQAGAEPPLPA